MKRNPWWIIILIWGMVWISLRLWLKPDHSPNAIHLMNHLNKSYHPDAALYFLGTSRVQRGIDTAILSTPQNQVINLALSNGTLTTSLILASRLNQIPGQKEIWIEITPYSKLIKPEMTLFFSANQILDTFCSLFPISFHEQILLRLDYYNKVFFYWLSGKKILRAFFQSQKTEWLGFISSNEHYPTTKQWFQTGFLPSEPHSSLVPKMAAQGIQQLIVESKARGNTIRFFLPLAFKSPIERSYAFELFDQIPPQNKILHDPAFLKVIQNPTLWRDATHMNQKGATVYSKWLRSRQLQTLNNGSY